jgi:hypothetical protein
MAGPVAIDPTRKSRRTAEFGRATQADIPGFLAIMQVLHSEPTSAAFARLLTKRLRDGDHIPLAHLFEEISVLAGHRLIPEELLFDAFAFDLYWDELKDTVLQVRNTTNNPKFCENFEAVAVDARSYRSDR